MFSVDLESAEAVQTGQRISSLVDDAWMLGGVVLVIPNPAYIACRIGGFAGYLGAGKTANASAPFGPLASRVDGFGFARCLTLTQKTSTETSARLV